MYNCFHVRLLCSVVVYSPDVHAYMFVAALFAGLEETAANGETRSTELGIQSYGVSMTTLEEVFLRLEELEEQETPQADHPFIDDIQCGESQKLLYGSVDNSDHAIQSSGRDEQDEEDVDKSTLRSGQSSARGRKLYWQQFMAMLFVRYLITMRTPMAVFFRLILPPVFIIVGVLVTRNLVPEASQPVPLQITPSLYLSDMNVHPPLCRTQSNMNPSVLVSTYNESYVNSSYSFLLKSFANQTVGYCQPSVSTNSTYFNRYLLDNWPHSVALKLGKFESTNEVCGRHTCIVFEFCII